jgi:hypothetical protein
MLAEALFERIDALGAREATIQLADTAVAYGFAAAIPDRLDVTVGYGRGERSSAHTIQMSIRIEPQPDSNVLTVSSASEIA